MYKISDPKNQYKSIKSTINLLKNHSEWVGLLLIVCCYLDTFCGDTSRHDHGEKFKKYLENNFKQYFDNIMTPNDFYLNYRNSIVHNFKIGEGYAIANSHEEFFTTKNECVVKGIVEEKEYVILNINKFIDDFILHVEKKFNFLND